MDYMTQGFLSYLLSTEALSKKQIANLAKSRENDVRFLEHIQLNGLPQDMMLLQFEVFYGLPYINLMSETIVELTSLPIDLNWLIVRGALPFYRYGHQLSCAFSKPLTEEERADVLALFQKEVTLYLADSIDIQQILFDVYITKTPRISQSKDMSPVFYLHPQEGIKREKVDQLISAIVECALIQQASDIHFSPEEGWSCVSFRIDGALHQHVKIGTSFHDLVLNKIKLLAGMDIAEKRLPQEGRFTVDHHGQLIDIRVATLLLHRGEKLVLRLLPQSFTRSHLSEVDFSADHILQVDKLLSRKQGFLLVTGPTNSGKSTTLYTFLKQLTHESLAIYTVEDPIEAYIPHTHQVQVNRKGGLDFQTALRGILREDPDVVLIGEIRDEETAQIAVRAALTGHLVLASLHAPFAQGALERLRDLGLSDAIISATLLGVINQRLLISLCSICQGAGKVEDGVCCHCQGTGRSGRIGVHEIWQLDEDDRQMIRAGIDSSVLRTKSLRKGFKGMVWDAKQKAHHGLLSLSQKENRWLIEEAFHGDV